MKIIGLAQKYCSNIYTNKIIQHQFGIIDLSEAQSKIFIEQYF